MISLLGVSKFYHENARVLHNVQLGLAPEDFVFILGDSGAGKSTLLKLITGEEKPSMGKALLDNRYHLSSNSNPIYDFRKRMGIIHQDIRLLEDRTVLENVAIPLYFGRAGTGVNEIKESKTSIEEAVESTLEQVGIPLDLMRERVETLSGGEKQRVAAARAIINSPDILIADEPTGSLDEERTDQLMNLFQKLNLDGMTVVLATHDRDLAKRTRHDTVHLRDGRLFDERSEACIF